MNVKTTLYLVAALGISLSSCTEQLEKQVKQLTQAKDSLVLVIQEKDNLITQNQALLDKIDNALVAISEKEKSLENESPNPDAKKRILSEITQLQDKIAEYKKKYQSNLNYISSLKNDITRYQDIVTVQKSQLESKEGEITTLKGENASLKDKIVKTNHSIDSLAGIIKQRESAMADNETEARKVYYIVGTKNDLIAKGIINKKGTQLNGKPDSKLFTQIDYNRTTSLPIMAKKVTILTPHGKDSYEFFSSTAQKTDSMHIVKPKEFWSVSKYLVIVIK